MGKVIDITDKLDFAGPPVLKIRDTEISVKTDAATMLKIMGILSDNENPGVKEITGMYEMLFSDQDKKKIEKLNLDFNDFTVVIQSAIGLVTGDTAQGEQ